MGPPGFEPGTKGLCLPLRLSPPARRPFVVWTMPSPHRPAAVQVVDYSLYTFPLLGDLARRWELKPFAEFTTDYCNFSAAATHL